MGPRSNMGYLVLRGTWQAMAVNRDKPDRWKADIAKSVDLYNSWFLSFAPTSFRETRINATKNVENAVAQTDNLVGISPEILANNPRYWLF